MFKKIKENEKVQKIRELWKNPKTHDVAVLVFWLIFITVVIVFMRMSTPNTTTNYETNLNSFSNIRSYDFRCKTNDLEVNGKAYNDALVFYLNNKQYYYKNKVYLIDDEIKVEDYDLGVLKINSKFLNNLVSGIVPTGNDNFKQYLVPLDRFINLYDYDTDLDLSKAATYNIVVSVYFKDDIINKVILDLSSYYTLKSGKEINYPVTIYYYNLNNVSDFTKGYDKVVEVK